MPCSMYLSSVGMRKAADRLPFKADKQLSENVICIVSRFDRALAGRQFYETMVTKFVIADVAMH